MRRTSLPLTFLLLLVGCDPASATSESEGSSGENGTSGGDGPEVSSSSTSTTNTTGGEPEGTTDPFEPEETTGSETGEPAPECSGEDPPVICYGGDPQTLGVGACRAGTQTCEDERWSDCAGEVLPERESCNGEDDDCDGDVDEGCECLPDETQSCYDGEPETEGVGQCVAGARACMDGAWGACDGQVVPQGETCDGTDDDCDGDIDEGCDCSPGETQSCYPGAAETADVGACASGTQTCDGSGVWGPCEGAVLPSEESCNGDDDDCDGDTDELEDASACDTGDDGVCGAGVLSCEGGGLVCEPTETPSVEVCDGDDNDCDGETDEELTDDPILLEGELSDDWSGAVLVGSYPAQGSGFVPARLDDGEDVDWVSVFAEEQVLDVFGDTPVSGTVTLQSPGDGFSYRVCACWSTATSLCGKNASGGVASCATASNGGTAQVNASMTMVQGQTDTGYLDIQVYATAGSETGCETYDLTWVVAEG